MNTSNFHVSLLCSPKIHPICPLVFHIPLLIGVTFPSFHFLISSSVHYRDGCHFQVSSNMEIILKLHKQIYIYCLYTFIYPCSLCPFTTTTFFVFQEKIFLWGCSFTAQEIWWGCALSTQISDVYPQMDYKN